MKNLFILPLFILFLLGCTDEDVFDTSSQTLSEEPNLRYGGDGKYDLLGHGCDVTNDFFLGKLRVVDNDKLMSVAAFAINPDETEQRREEIVSDYTAESFLKKITTTKAIGGGASFGKASLTKTFSSSDSYTVENSFATVQRFIQKKSYTYGIDADFIVDLDCLSPEFKYALSKYTPEKIISMFGTHVYTNVRLGGVLDVTYRAKVTKSEKERLKITEAGASAAFKSVYNADVKYSKSEQEKAIKETNNYSFVATARGGNVSIPLSKQEIKDLKIVTVVDTYEWEKSIGNEGKGNAFIDFEPGSLIPLWEFVQDDNLRESLRTAIEQYLEANQYKDVISKPIPLYEHFTSNRNSYDHYYSTNPISPTGSGWAYGNQGIICYIYNTQVKNTVPLYDLYSSYALNHYFSIDPSTPLHYSHNGIVGYIYPNQEEGTVALYSFWIKINSSYENHYCSTNPTAYNGYTRQGIVGYVYPKDYQ